MTSYICPAAHWRLGYYTGLTLQRSEASDRLLGSISTHRPEVEFELTVYAVGPHVAQGLMQYELLGDVTSVTATIFATMLQQEEPGYRP